MAAGKTPRSDPATAPSSAPALVTPIPALRPGRRSIPCHPAFTPVIPPPPCHPALDAGPRTQQTTDASQRRSKDGASHSRPSFLRKQECSTGHDHCHFSASAQSRGNCGAMTGSRLFGREDAASPVIPPPPLSSRPPPVIRPSPLSSHLPPVIPHLMRDPERSRPLTPLGAQAKTGLH